MSTGPTIPLKEYFEKLLEEKEKTFNQRFESQEKAVDTEKSNRDTAINKAETSIEKKSDAVYVKLTDLQNAFSAVMLRPEIEARFKGLSEKVDDLKTSRDTGVGKVIGNKDVMDLIKLAILIAGFFLGYFILK